MKKLEKILSFATIFLIATSLTAQNSTVDSLALQGRIYNLELMRDNMSHELELHKQELGLEVHRSHVYIILGIATTVFGAGWILWGILGLRKSLIVKAESYLDAELLKQFPATTRQRINDLVNRVLPEEIEPFLNLVREKKKEDEMKANSKIILIAETQERGREAEKDFRESGFKDVSIYLPETDELPLAHLYAFIRREPKPDDGWSKLSDAYIKRILDQNRKNETRGFFYYGPYNDSLDPKMHPRFGLANMPSTLGPRIIELLSKPLTPQKS
jgi:hypothetical protein